MAVDDYLDSEVAVVAAATAAVFSPQVRGAMRKGLVYGTAGVMTAGDAAVSAAKGAGNAVQRAVGRGSNSNRASSANSRSRSSSGGTRARSSGTRRSTRSKGRTRSTASRSTSGSKGSSS